MTKAAELAAKLRRSVQTASNDDWSEAGTQERRRHAERLDAMIEAAEYLEAPHLVPIEALSGKVPIVLYFETRRDAEEFAGIVKLLMKHPTEIRLPDHTQPEGIVR